MFKKILTIKNLIIATIATFTLIAFIGLGGYLAFNYDISKIQEATMKYWETGDTRRAGTVTEFAIKNNSKKQFVLTKYDLTNPVATVVLLKELTPANVSRVQWETFYLKRTSLFEFTVQESIISYSITYTYEEARELAKKYDVYKQNPDKANIINDPGLNLPQDKLQKVLADKAKNEQLDKNTAVFNALPKEERIKICQDNLSKMKAEYEASLKGEKVDGDVILPENLEPFKKLIDSTDCSKV
jgi:hypothetical protein